MPKVKLLNVEYIKQLLEERGMTVKDLATATGFSEKTIKKYLDGADQKGMSIRLPYKFALVLKVSCESMLYDEEFRVYSE